MCLTAFFANEITYENIFNFLLLWLLVDFILLLIYMIIKFLEYSSVVMVKSFVFAIFVLIILNLLFNKMSSVLFEIQTTLLITVFLFITSIFQKFNQQKLVSYISYLPFFFLLLSPILLIKDYFENVPLLFKFLIILVLALITNLLTFKLIFNLEVKFEKRINLSQGSDAEKASNLPKKVNVEKTQKSLLFIIIDFFYNMMFESKANSGNKLILSLLLLFLFIFTPRLMFICGHGIRTFNIPNKNHIEINYINQNGNKETVIGNYYIEHNSTLFISNMEWELETIKPLSYQIKLLDETLNSQE